MKDTEESRDVPFLYNAHFFVLTLVCSMPLLHFGGERLFGIGTLCLLAVYILLITFRDTKSSVIGFVISVAIMQFAIFYSIGPLVWQSIFNLVFLLVYNVFIILTGGLGLLQFQIFRREEVDFCANVEYFLFFLYPPCCVFILMWLISWTFGAYLAPYMIIAIGFPVLHAFLDTKLKPSFTTKHDCVLGQAEKMLVFFNFIFSPSFVYCLINFFDLLQPTSWISVLFCLFLPMFLVTLLDTSDLRDMAEIRNWHWQIVQVLTCCLSLILGCMLVYLHGIVDGLNAIYLAVILLCTTALFIAVKYRFSKIICFVASGLLLSSYFAWCTLLPWNVVFSMGNEISLSFFTVELLVSSLAVISVVAVTISLSVRFRLWLNQVLILHTLGFVILEVVMMDGEVYSPYVTILTSAFVSYMVQRLHQVKRLHKTPAVMCVALHGCKLLFMFTSLNTKPTIGALSSMVVLCGGFCLCVILTNILVFEYERNLDRNEISVYAGIFFVSLVLLSSTFLRTLYIFLTHNDPSPADITGFILILTGACCVKLTFLHSDDEVTRKQSILIIVVGVLVSVFQPHFNIFEVLLQIPKLIFREMIYETWHVVFAEYVILPWSMLLSVSLIMLLLLKLLSLNEMTSLAFNVISVFIGAPLGLAVAHWVLPYPKLSSSILSIPYMVSTSMATNSLFLVLKGRNINTNLKKYSAFFIVSMISILGENAHNIRIIFLQSELSPSVLYQIFLHFLFILQGKPPSGLHISLDKKSSFIPSVVHNASVLLIFVNGLIFSPKPYYDILLVPFCGSLLLLRMRDFGFLKNGDYTVKRVTFAGIMGFILYCRVMQQLPWGRWSFWIVIAFMLEISVILVSFVAYFLALFVFWYESISESEERFLAVFAPVFTLLLFYGRSSAGQVLGIIGPTLAYSAFHFPSR